MISANTVKIAAAFVLSASLALPQYTCSGFVGPNGKKVSFLPVGADKSRYGPITQYHYALEHIQADDPISWLFWPVVFLWPLGVAVHGRWRRDSQLARAVWWINPILVGGSAYFIYALGKMGDRALGNFVALGALGLYGAVWLGEAVGRAVGWHRGHLTPR